MSSTEDKTYDFASTDIGALRVRVRRYTAFTVDDLVESRAQGLAASMRLEQRRVLLAKANQDLQGIVFDSGLTP